MSSNRHAFGDALALFARDFDDPAALDDVILLDDQESSEAPPESEPPPNTTALLEEACAAARAEGLRQGRAEAAAGRDAERDAMMASLLAGLRGAEATLRETVEIIGTRLAGLVLAALEASFPTLCMRHGTTEVIRFTRDIVGLLGEEPRIVIRVHPTLQPPLEAMLAGLEPERREAILVEPRDTIPPGDARIAWRHGLATRDTAALRGRLAEVLAPLGLTSGDSHPEIADFAADESLSTV